MAGDTAGRISGGRVPPARVVMALAYPFVIYAGLNFIRPRLLATGLALVLLVHLGLAWRRGRVWEALSAVADRVMLVVVLFAAALFDEGRIFLFAPALTNLGFFCSFGSTLVRGPSMVEVFARMTKPDLPPEALVYCRRLTALWCLFFILNSAVITWLALHASLAWWTLYTGCLAYALAGGFFLIELLYRRRRFAPQLYQGGAVRA
jgi:uncharacterized membrane protein